jgi:hypothetical protein
VRPAAEAGLTLAEILVVTAILAILLVVTPGPMAWIIQRNTQAAGANDLIGAIALAQSEALASGWDVVLCGGTAAGCDTLGRWSGYIAFADRNRDEQLSAGELLRVWPGPRPPVRLIATSPRVTWPGRAWPVEQTVYWRVCRADPPTVTGIVMWASGVARALEADDLPCNFNDIDEASGGEDE